MTAPKRVLLLVGSPRGSKSTSYALGDYLLERLKSRGATIEFRLLYKSLASDEGLADLLVCVARAELIVLSTPLYVDSLPSRVIRTLEYLAEKADLRGKSLLAIVQCGFPEALHNRTALAICRQFASEREMVWVGGLALGMGEIIHGKPLLEAGGMVRKVVAALDLTAEELAEGRPVPDEAVALMAKPFVPIWLYAFMGNRGWKKQAKGGAAKKLRDKPYET